MKLDFNYQTKVLTLPGAVAEKLEGAGENDLKVLLYLAAHPEATEAFDAAKLATQLNISDREIEQSVAFWRGAGILKAGKGSAKKAAAQAEAEKEEEVHPIVSARVVSPSELPIYTGAEVEELMKKRKKLASLLRDCQNILGKVFNVSESNKIIALCDYLHLKDDYILLLCSYCKSKDRGSVAYLASEAYRLYNEEIISYSALEEYIAGRERQQDFDNFIRHLTGIGARKLTAKEKRFLENWASFKLPNEVVAYGYELSVDATGTLSFPHLNKILEGWNAAGIKTLEEAKANATAHAEEMKKLYARKSDTPKAGKSEKKEDFESFDTDDFFSAALKRGEKK